MLRPPYPRPMKGQEAVIAFNRSVWEDVYFPDCSVEILDEIGGEALSAVRFIYRARYRASSLPYENEYTLFARGGLGGIREVFEALDTLAIFDQMKGEEKGTALTKLTR